MDKSNPYFAKGNPNTEAWVSGVINTKLYIFSLSRLPPQLTKESVRADSASPATKLWIPGLDIARKSNNLNCSYKTTIKSIYKHLIYC